jgi:abortive infection bacteriophage resistance protein
LAGFLFHFRMCYTKAALTFEQQLHLLKERHLVVPDDERALRWLKNISYYRLSAYFLPFKTGESFRHCATFDLIAGLYIFDRKLRLTVLDAIERIEVALRTAVTYQLAHEHGPFGYADARNFAPNFNHQSFLNELHEERRRSKETFVEHFAEKYTDEGNLPVWMATELLSFGVISRLFRALNPVLKAAIAQPFNVHHNVLGTWLHALSYVRNVCAHHQRLWNRTLAIRPQIPTRSHNWPHEPTQNNKLYCVLVIINHLLKTTSPNCRWKHRLISLFDNHPEVTLSAMCVPENWRAQSLWQLD